MKKIIALAMFALSMPALAAEGRVVPMHKVDASGSTAAIGHIGINETAHGLVLMPSLTGLPPGLHGFHLHSNPDCSPKEQDGKKVPALAAGGHYDPANTQRHAGPWGDGHLGDLPALTVAADGSAAYPVLAPRLKMADVTGRSLIIHEGGDNHADEPARLGGGGARIACGIIP